MATVNCVFIFLPIINRGNRGGLLYLEKCNIDDSTSDIVIKSNLDAPLDGLREVYSAGIELWMAAYNIPNFHGYNAILVVLVIVYILKTINHENFIIRLLNGVFFISAVLIAIYCFYDDFERRMETNYVIEKVEKLWPSVTQIKNESKLAQKHFALDKSACRVAIEIIIARRIGQCNYNSSAYHCYSDLMRNSTAQDEVMNKFTDYMTP